MTGERILVTGASGFVAGHTILALLRAGHNVRGSARRPERVESLRRHIEMLGLPDDRFDCVPADLTRDDGWPEAMEGCHAVVHVASPFPLQPPKSRNDLVIPAREGTQRVLSHAAGAGIRRVVLTSSIVAVIYPAIGHTFRVYTEADWTDVDRGDLSSYVVSKTLAERAAWRFVEESGGAIDLTSCNPGLVLGPALGSHLSSSLEVLRRMMRGQYPGYPRAGYPIVDVRDVADLHVAALADKGTIGKRIIVAEGYLRFAEMAAIAAAAVPEAALRLKRPELPDFAVRMASLFDRSVSSVVVDLGVERRVSSALAREILGQALRDPEEAVRAAALSLRDLALV